VLNFFTKEVATIAGLSFTAVFLVIFNVSEHYHEKKRGSATHHHLEQFNQRASEDVAPATLDLRRPYRKLVAIRSTQNLFMLEKTLAETDPETTDVIVMTAKYIPPTSNTMITQQDFDHYDQELMTAVVDRAEKAGKEVKPLILPTNNPLFAIVNSAKSLQAQELILGASNVYTPDEQLEQIAFYWINLHPDNKEPLTVRLLSRNRDVYLDLNGGNRIPRISERQARSVADLRAAGVGVSRVMMVHADTSDSSDLFTIVLTMLDPQVTLTLVTLPAREGTTVERNWLRQDLERAGQLRREVDVQELPAGDPAKAIVELAKDRAFDVVIIGLASESATDDSPKLDTNYVVRHAPCRVFPVASLVIPQDVVEEQSTPRPNDTGHR
jgi:nucleotide-binding universal stress UspA family protein